MVKFLCVWIQKKSNFIKDFDPKKKLTISFIQQLLGLNIYTVVFAYSARERESDTFLKKYNKIRILYSDSIDYE